MSESVLVSSVPASAPKKSKSATGATKKPKPKPSHPKTAEMVNAAISGLKERGGSSLQAIKKYIAANYKVDADKLAPFIRNYLKSAVTSGSLVQTKGKGASGSFKLAEKKPAKKISKPTKAAKVVNKSKTPGDKKPKSAPKAKKAKKVPTKKPKAPKPKKVGSTKGGATKKAAAAKK